MASGRRYKFRNFEFWAVDGMVAILDLDKAGSTEESVREATKYLRPGEFMKNAIAARIMLQLTDPWEGRRMLECAHACVREAVKQGNIFDPKQFREMAEERKPIIVSTANLDIPRRNPIEKLASRSISPNEAKDVLIGGISKYLED